MYTLLSRIDKGLDPLKANFEKHVKQTGLDEILKEAKDAAEVLFFLNFKSMIICASIYFL